MPGLCPMAAVRASAGGLNSNETARRNWIRAWPHSEAIAQALSGIAAGSNRTQPGRAQRPNPVRSDARYPLPIGTNTPSSFGSARWYRSGCPPPMLHSKCLASRRFPPEGPPLPSRRRRRCLLLRQRLYPPRRFRQERPPLARRRGPMIHQRRRSHRPWQ